MAPTTEQVLNISTHSSTYPVVCGQNTLNNFDTVLREHYFDRLSLSTSTKAVIISDSNVAPIYAQNIREALSRIGSKVIEVVLPAGESTKSIEALYPIYETLISNGVDRKGLIIALGGGVIGDAAGYIAASYLRGINIVQIPTTLLSMVDSSIGGKVGINHTLGKNLIGAFHPPSLVVVDTNVLETLPSEEFSAGLAECVKHALISSDELFSWTSEASERIIQKDPSILMELIVKNLKVKQTHVENDEFEQGIRAFLNFGHTIGHAIEKAPGMDKHYNHGQAVGLGMLAALKLSEQCLDLPNSVLSSVKHLLTKFNLPTHGTLPPLTELIALMARDKKNSGGETTFVLLSKIGAPEKYSKISSAQLEEAYQYIQADAPKP